MIPDHEVQAPWRLKSSSTSHERDRSGSGLAEVSLGIAGQTSGNIDVSEVLAQKLPLYLGVVMGLSFLVLILVFRSILVPLVASMGFPLLGAGKLGAMSCRFTSWAS